ncbi:MAG: hypothetical protein U9Q82_04875 [Chloroflexota bacterium]|nr:hypothetical protein [Chloroflexota bacterium]
MKKIMTLVVSDLDGTLTTGSSWRGLRRYFTKHYSAWAYNLFFSALAATLPTDEIGIVR